MQDQVAPLAMGSVATSECPNSPRHDDAAPFFKVNDTSTAGAAGRGIHASIKTATACHIDMISCSEIPTSKNSCDHGFRLDGDFSLVAYVLRLRPVVRSTL